MTNRNFVGSMTCALMIACNGFATPSNLLGGWRVIEHNGTPVTQNVEWVIQKNEIWICAGEMSAPVILPFQYSGGVYPPRLRVNFNEAASAADRDIIYRLEDDRLTLKAHKFTSVVPLKHFEIEPNSEQTVLERIKTDKSALHKLASDEFISTTEISQVMASLGDQISSSIAEKVVVRTNVSESVCLKLIPKLNQNHLNRLAYNEIVSDAVLSTIVEYSDFETARYIFNSERSSSETKTKALDMMTDQILAWSHNRDLSEIVKSPLTSEATLWKLIKNGWDTAKEVLRNKNVTEEMVMAMVKSRAEDPRNSQTKEFDLMISHPLIIQGVPCSERTSFDRFGKLIKTTLSEDFVTNDLILPADTTISFYASGTIYKYTPKSDITIQEITCAGAREITFYESGKVKRAFIKDNHDVRGVPCAGGQYLDFLESGALENGAKVHFSNAKLLRASGKLEEALAEVNLALKDSPSDVDGLIERGIINQSRKHIRDAQADFRKVLTLDLNNSVAHYGLAGCFWALNDWNQVINHCTTAISVILEEMRTARIPLQSQRNWLYNSIYSPAFHLRAMAYQNIGKYEKAIFDFNQALEQMHGNMLKQQIAEVANNLAWLLATCPKNKYRDGEQALTLAQKSVEMKRSGPRLDTLAAALAETGDFKEAVRIQKEAVSAVKKEGLLNLLDPLNQRLDFYKKGRPWRE